MCALNWVPSCGHGLVASCQWQALKLPSHMRNTCTFCTCHNNCFEAWLVQKHKAALSSAMDGSDHGHERETLSPFTSTSSLDADDATEADSSRVSAAMDATRSGSVPMPLQRGASFFAPTQIPQSQLMKLAVAVLHAVAVRSPFCASYMSLDLCTCLR